MNQYDMDLILLIGIQATGKSTFYHQQFRDTHIRINLDMLKTRHREDILLGACLDAKLSCVIDNTEVRRVDRQYYFERAQYHRCRVIGYYFQSNLADALKRNRDRLSSKPIPDKAIISTSKRLELPSYQEGFHKLYYVKMNAIGTFDIEEWVNEV